MIQFCRIVSHSVLHLHHKKQRHKVTRAHIPHLYSSKRYWKNSPYIYTRVCASVSSSHTSVSRVWTTENYTFLRSTFAREPLSSVPPSETAYTCPDASGRHPLPPSRSTPAISLLYLFLLSLSLSLYDSKEESVHDAFDWGRGRERKLGGGLLRRRWRRKLSGMCFMWVLCAGAVREIILFSQERGSIIVRGVAVVVCCP